MKLKRISALVLALAMTASVAAFAAEENPDVILDDEIVRQVNEGAMIGGDPTVVLDDDVMMDVNHQQGDIWLLSAPMGGGLGGLMIPIAIARNFATTLTINGEALEEYTYEKDIPGSWESETITVTLTDLPAVGAGYVPMRAIVQADGGYAQWFKDSNMSRFVICGRSIEVSFLDLSVTVDGELVEGVQAILEKGTTYLPISVIDGLEGFTVEDLSEDGVEIYNIKTPNGAAIVKFAKSLMETAGMGMGESVSLEDLELFWGESYGFTADMLTEAYVTLPMMISPDTIMIGKIAEGQEEAFEAVLEAYRAAQESTFSWYLAQNLPKVEDARFVTEGDWFMFLIGENADEVVEQFRAGVQTLDAEA